MTSQQPVVATSGSYTANLLGNIRSHLAGLQGFDVMALELIQNADDAKAEKIIFDITDNGLVVTNSGQFTYCGELNKRPCKFIQNESDYSCDYHRIVDVGSGGKLTHSENIGRFGIGFVSTYQITDHPQIYSSGIKLTLHPESGQWFVEPDDQTAGTTFFLPWATNPNTEARLALGVSHVSVSHIEQLAKDIQKILRKSLLFLRYVTKAEVRNDGELLLACDLERGDSADLTISFRPGKEVEKWLILRTDAEKMAEELYESHPRLEALGRGTKISIGLRIEPEPLNDGLLYAFLPTEQPTGLPLHINADFFPESDRKALIFAGHQHEQAWNEMLIGAAAAELARDPEALFQKLGHTQLWQILSRCFELPKPQNHPECFNVFWEEFKTTAPQTHIVVAKDNSLQCPNGVFIARPPLNDEQVLAFQQIGGKVAIEDLRPHQNAMNQLGSQILTLERMVNLLEQSMNQYAAGVSQVTEQEVNSLFHPVWSIVNDLLPEIGAQNQASALFIQKLSAIPFIITEDLYVVTINQSFLVLPTIDSEKVAKLLPKQFIASHYLHDLPRISKLINKLELAGVASHLQSSISSDEVEDVIGVEHNQLRELYQLFYDLDRQGDSDKSVYTTLVNLPIWLSSRGLIKANQALLPGNFHDPTGEAELFDVSVLTESARDFITTKLGVQTQSIEAYVQTVVPRLFDENGPLEIEKYLLLITELAEHPSLVNDDNILKLLGSLPIVPTQDGKWSLPHLTYRQTDALVKVLGDSKHLWLDFSCIPNTRSVHSFIESLGIRRSPIARHLVERMIYIAENYLPTEEARRASAEAFYVLCENYEDWKDKKSFQRSIENLMGAECIPAVGDKEKWHEPESLYAPYRSEAFESQANILDFRNFARLKRELIEELGVTINPDTEMVVNHLLYCVERDVQPHVSTYQMLNERAQNADPVIKSLVGTRCVYVESQKLFVRPNQIYWMPQQLGKYAFTIPGNIESFKPLFTAIGVKNSPDAEDYVDLLLDIVKEHYEQAKTVTGASRVVYDTCLSGIAAADAQDQFEHSELMRLQESPIVLNLKNQLIFPDEIFLQDSEWHVSFFHGELDSALCKPALELWPLLDKIGVQRLSDCAEVSLEYVDGENTSEDVLAEKLAERAEIIARLLHDKPITLRDKMRKALFELKATSYDVVRIQATVAFGDNKVTTPPVPAFAYYNADDSDMILARPVNDRSWPHVLNALFHQLMPEESSSEISKLTLAIKPLMSMSLEDAHQELTDFGIPYLSSNPIELTDDLTSPELGVIGGEPVLEGEQSATSDIIDDQKSEELSDHGKKLEPQTDEGQSSGGNGTAEGTSEQWPFGAPRGRGDQEGNSVKKPQPQKRAKHKEQWDRCLRSYVRKRTESDEASDSSTSEHNLAVESVARKAVCDHERKQGRIAEQMPQTHPGYDIFSRNPLTGEERYIEVKGISGEWNKTGVGLSKLQFSNAQDLGEKYWLYAVEFVFDPNNIRVHPICSPANQVTSFMFDGSWREAVSEEPDDPSLAFIEGVRVNHKHYGLGRIVSMVMRGSTRVLSIDFDLYGKKTVLFNLREIEVVEDEYGEDAP